jgi:tetratricopeptide (TPR) repeat protein
MNEHNKKVEPVRFEPAGGAAVEPQQAVAEAATGRGGSNSEKWVVPALAGLVLLALLVIFWLPQQIGPGEVVLETPPAETPSGAPRPKPAADESSPWSDAQLARQRKEAQDVLAQLLEVQFDLEEHAVEQWAAEDFAAAQAQATSADELYRQQEFNAATQTYQTALEAMLDIQGRIDAVFQQTLESGFAALRSDQAEAAITALELALVLKPDHPQALAGLQRARNLEPLLALLAEANSASDSGELDTARQILQQAVALDPEHAGAAAQLKGVERAITRRDFNRAMTAGYQALDGGDFDEAQRQFKAAQSIMPSASEPQGALQQTRIARTQAQIEAWRQRAVAAEKREDWNKAIAAYREILNIDETVVFARDGLARSNTRAQIDQRLKRALEKPERLSDERIYRDTQTLYRQALTLEQKGPLLKEQLIALDDLLEKALIPIPVLLQSDEQTDVTVYKVAHLGAFRRQQLSLKPGVYTAVGVRTGYRDVRKQFTVDHDRQSVVVEIACTEPI